MWVPLTKVHAGLICERGGELHAGWALVRAAAHTTAVNLAQTVTADPGWGQWHGAAHAVQVNRDTLSVAHTTRIHYTIATAAVAIQKSTAAATSGGCINHGVGRAAVANRVTIAVHTRGFVRTRDQCHRTALARPAPVALAHAAVGVAVAVRAL